MYLWSKEAGLHPGVAEELGNVSLDSMFWFSRYERLMIDVVLART